MSVNTAHANNGVLIHAGEFILLFSDNVTMEFSGQDNPLFKGSKTGRIYLTTHRMIFNTKHQSDPLQSFSFPFVSLNDVDIEQPTFGANYIKGKVRAQPNGNWIGETKFKLFFKSGGAIDFGQAMLRAARMAQRNFHNDAPPPYTPPSGAWYEAPQPAYAPNPQGYYGWVPPTHAFPNAPPPNSVFMTDNPPPYPGIVPPQQAQGYSAPGYGGNGANGPYPQGGGWAQPPQGPYQPPNGGSFPPPQQGGSYPSPQGGSYPPPQQGGSYPPQGGTYPPMQGGGSYPPPQGGSYPPPQGGSYPPMQGGSYPSPQGGSYPPQQGGSYPPPQGGSYPPPQGGSYPPPQGGSYPPPYGGQQPGGYPPPQGPSRPVSKEEEAAQSAYYDPNQPQTAYVPPPAYYEPPPSYNSLAKKDQ